MTRKRYTKLLMAAGADRNTANAWATSSRASGWDYGEVVKEDCHTVEILARFMGPGKFTPQIRPHKLRKPTDGLRIDWAFVDETPLIPGILQKRIAEEIKKKPPHLEMTAAYDSAGRIKRIIEVSLVASGGYPLGGGSNE